MKMLVLLWEDQSLSSQAFQMAPPSPTSLGKTQQRQGQPIQFPKFPTSATHTESPENNPSSCLWEPYGLVGIF